MQRRFGKLDSFHTKSSISINSKIYQVFCLKKASQSLGDLSNLPYTIKILLEMLLRFEDGVNIKKHDIEYVAQYANSITNNEHEIAFYPTRVLMQDFTGVPAIVDLAAMRDAIMKQNGSIDKVNPIIPVDLVIDHSVQVDAYKVHNAFDINVSYEMHRNRERYKLLRWGQQAFSNFRVVPPGTGICHQVNLEYLSKVVWTETIDGYTFAYPDTLVGTDSHTTMVNGLSVLGWGVGGIEAEAAMLGQPISMLVPEVIGVKLTGRLGTGVTATDLVLTVTQMLREQGVVGKFVEFYGNGVASLSLADRATVANMAPEYGATCGFFPVDNETIKYLQLTGRDSELVELVEVYAKEQGLWRDDSVKINFHSTIELDLATVETSMAGPKRPQDRVVLSSVMAGFAKALPTLNTNSNNINRQFAVADANYTLKNGDVVIAAITSCTNTSNPYVMLGAGLLARNAVMRGLISKPWVKTSLAPGSQVVTEYLEKAGLYDYLEKLGFALVGYGCTTCIGNSGPLLPTIERTIAENDLVVCAILSGNRNFEGRIHPLVRANYLASPILCVAYAIAGTVNINLATEPLATDIMGKPVYLRDILPAANEIDNAIASYVDSDIFKKRYSDVFTGTLEWNSIQVNSGPIYQWSEESTYIKRPPYFDHDYCGTVQCKIENARILAILGDSITTDHISPAGSIAKDSPAAQYLLNNNVLYNEFNSYGARRGNHELMVRGTFANPRIKNKIANGMEGGYSRYYMDQELKNIYEVAMCYMQHTIPLVVFAGKEYGTGSSRDWAAKGPSLLGVKAVIAESFERIHRSNLLGMGILPLMLDGITLEAINLTGDEVISIYGDAPLYIKQRLSCFIKKADEVVAEISVICRVDTDAELGYIRSGGILQHALKELIKSK